MDCMTPTIDVQVGKDHQEQQQKYDSLWLCYSWTVAMHSPMHVARIMHMCQTMLSKFSNAVCAHRVRKVWKMARKQVYDAPCNMYRTYTFQLTHISVSPAPPPPPPVFLSLSSSSSLGFLALSIQPMPSYIVAWQCEHNHLPIFLEYHQWWLPVYSALHTPQAWWVAAHDVYLPRLAPKPSSPSLSLPSPSWSTSMQIEPMSRFMVEVCWSLMVVRGPRL